MFDVAVRGQMKPSKIKRQEARRTARESRELAVVLGAFSTKRLTEAGELGAVMPGGPAGAEGIKFSVVLISEGLGNRRNMNYYGREAIASAPAIFEGKPCFLNHPSVTDEQDIPERRVQDKCGYFKNVSVAEGGDGRRSVIGELHFDLSETGRLACEKARTALHYRQEFPLSSDEYVGLSVNADGAVEKRSMSVDGEKMDVNYVTEFTEAASCDLVTTPARGGRFLALVESMRGTLKTSTEDTRMVIKTLEAALAGLSAAEKLTGDKATKSRAEVRESLMALLAKAKESVAAAKKEDEAEESENDDADADDKPGKAGDEPAPKADEPKPKEEEAESDEAKVAKVKQAEADEKAAEAAEMYEKGHAMVAKAVAMGHKIPEAHMPAKKEDESEAEGCGEADEKMESMRLAIKSLLKESGVSEDMVDLKALCKGSLKDAKTVIAQTKKVSESLTRAIVRKLEVPAGHPSKGVSGNAAESNQALFAGVVRK